MSELHTMLIEPILDHATLREVQEAIGGQLDSVIRVYLDDTRKRLLEIPSLIVPVHKTAALILTAHSIRAGSAHLGVVRLTRLAGEMEAALRNQGDMTNEGELFQLLEQMKWAFCEIEDAFMPLCKADKIAQLT